MLRVSDKMDRLRGGRDGQDRNRVRVRASSGGEGDASGDAPRALVKAPAWRPTRTRAADLPACSAPRRSADPLSVVTLRLLMRLFSDPRKFAKS